MAARHDDEQLSAVGPIVSSAHLADSALPELSELEMALTIANHSFQRWLLRCMAAAGQPMSTLEVLILHLVNHRDRPKTLADICLILNIEDTHLANYAIRKLSAQGLVKLGRKGKEKTVSITTSGTALCLRYREVREAVLVKSARQAGFEPAEMSRLAMLLRSISGQYDHAARAAASL